MTLSKIMDSWLLLGMVSYLLCLVNQSLHLVTVSCPWAGRPPLLPGLAPVAYDDLKTTLFWGLRYRLDYRTGGLSCSNEKRL
jgi:hypothetical protein